ncbi:MAG: 50S ribosomal protein L29 [Candidatus Peregrinibacteria bacterium]
MLTLNELRSSSRKELLNELAVAQKELLQTHMGVVTKHKKDTSQQKKQKSYVAQIFTVLKEMDMEEAVKKANSVE